ncbi:type II secretion system protein J [Deinococcus sp. QL22]|uniref:PulJ/GspJ family protein n=1 Tax=Deinococcus sp. QL22 TaxID=2939437 RepID=UPI0020180C54|nr:type II secretion system protein [Deinococcus sp. QL22]UQN05552.1 type II secretion system GspH family protein [Deinococcus sp. QL22]
MIPATKQENSPVAQLTGGPALSACKVGHQAGFTIIEVLVSIMLLSIIVLVILTPLSGLFNMTRRSDQQIAATQVAQRTLETIRGEWLSGARYRQACVSAPIPQMTPPIAVNVQSLDREGSVTTTAALKTTCGTAADDPPLRRIQVVVKVGKAVSNLSVDVARP